MAVLGEVEVRVKNVNEDFPMHLLHASIPEFLSIQKANAFNGDLKSDEILITADTIVWFDQHVLNKPADTDEAIEMLKKLSGNTHQVFTGVTISTPEKRKTFCVESTVTFARVEEKQLMEYISHYKPFDKAGAYGAQECLPAGMNPLSEKEKLFLNKINQPGLFERSLAVKDHARLPLIKKIKGSYFNVMGLPLVELVKELEEMGLLITN